MGVPATTGQLRMNIKDMEIGDYIVWKMDSNGNHIMDGNISTTEIPVNGVANSVNLNGVYYWYAVKVARGLLVSDRVRSHTVSWDSLNSEKMIQGLPMTISGVNGIIRSLTGGCAYADANGNLSTNWITPAVGYFPLNNEWDKYIVNFSNIKKGYTLDDVFHWSNCYTWVQDTHYSTPANRILRGVSFDGKGGGQVPTSTSSTDKGFRPVFQYDESKL